MLLQYAPCLLFLLTHLAFAEHAPVFKSYCSAVCSQLVTSLKYSDCSSKSSTITKSTSTSCYCASKLLAKGYAVCITEHCPQDSPIELWHEFAAAYCTSTSTSSTPNATSSTQNAPSAPLVNTSHSANATAHYYTRAALSSNTTISGLTYAQALAATALKITPFSSVNSSFAISSPVNVSDQTFAPYYRTYAAATYQKSLGPRYGYYLIYYLSTVLGLGIVRNFMFTISRYLNVSRKAIVRRPNKIERLVQRSIFYPGARQHPYIFLGLSVPVSAGAHVYLCTGYVLFAIILSIVSYQGYIFNNNTTAKYTNNKAAQLLKYIADRTAYMSMWQLPFLFLFGGRNNILLKATGWSFRDFNLYHKWSGRVMWALALVHAVAYSGIYLRGGIYYSEFDGVPFFVYGTLAIVAGSIIMVQASRAFRKLAYEFFLIFHIILVAIFTVGVYYHITLKHNTLSLPFLWASIAIWSYNRVNRLLRLIYFNLGFGRTSRADITVVETVNFEDPVLLINIIAPRMTKAQPGQYVFVHFRGVRFWESHPFTVMDQDNSTGAIQLAAKVHNGITRSLYKHVKKNTPAKTLVNLTDPSSSAQPEIFSGTGMPIAIEGFYGSTAPITLYDTALLIAGGAGITSIYAYLRHLLQDPRSHTKYIRVIWVVRHTAHLGMLRSKLAALVEAVEGGCALDVEVFVTGSEPESTEKGLVGHGSEVDSASEMTTSPVDLTPAFDEKKQPIPSVAPSPQHSQNKHPTHRSNITIHQTRPNLPTIITSTVHDAPSSVGVLSCGPQSMMDTVCGAVGENVEASKGRLTYFEEAFQW